MDTFRLLGDPAGMSGRSDLAVLLAAMSDPDVDEVVLDRLATMVAEILVSSTAGQDVELLDA